MDGSAVDLLQEFERRVSTRKINRYEPYPWQLKFHAAGKDNPERMLRCANGVGKTFTCAQEVAFHMTGNYPEWWEGFRLNRPIIVWCGSTTNEVSRDVVQKELLGEVGAFGTGAIPGDKLVGQPSKRQCGIADVVDSFKVRHKSGGISVCSLKTYEQGWTKWQGAAVPVVWLDEEPEDQRIFSEANTRRMKGKGVLMVSFTPLLGATELVRHFAQPPGPGIHMTTATWDDAPHLDEQDKIRMMSSYPAHEIEARTKGVPIMGSGRVFPLAEETLYWDGQDIPAYWHRIAGMDFGTDHPTAVVWMAINRDTDTVYVYDAYRKSNTLPLVHAHAINSRGKDIPIAWPHDGFQEDKSSGIPMRDLYHKMGVSMLTEHAQYSDDRGNAVEPALLDMWQRMSTGRFKVARHLSEWFEEFRDYHREDGKVVKIRDDLMSATRYGVMMLRYASPSGIKLINRAPGPRYARLA